MLGEHPDYRPESSWGSLIPSLLQEDYHEVCSGKTPIMEVVRPWLVRDWEGFVSQGERPHRNKTTWINLKHLNHVLSVATEAPQPEWRWVILMPNPYANCKVVTLSKAIEHSQGAFSCTHVILLRTGLFPASNKQGCQQSSAITALQCELGALRALGRRLPAIWQPSDSCEPPKELRNVKRYWPG